MTAIATTSATDQSRWAELVRLPAYHVKEAARLAGVTVSTVRNWQAVQGGRGAALSKRDKRQSLSFMQLTELRVIAGMRDAGVSLEKIRRAREYLADKLHTEFPFASELVKTDGQDVILELDEAEGSDLADRVLVANKGGQYSWKAIIGDKFKEFEYLNFFVMRWRIKRGGAQIIVDPMVAFGKPTVHGVPTWVVISRSRSGESRKEIADDYGLTVGQVSAALDFEKLAPKKNQASPSIRLH